MSCSPGYNILLSILCQGRLFNLDFETISSESQHEIDILARGGVVDKEYISLMFMNGGVTGQ